MTDTMDFTPAPHAPFAEAFEALLDDTFKAKKDADDAEYRATSVTMSRPAIGAGRLGNDCLRAIAYEYHRTPKDEGRGFSGRLFRIFDRGHWGEDKMAEYLRLAGFTLLTEGAAGKQFRFDLLCYDDGKGRIKGMADGVFTAGPGTVGAAAMRYPALWENKELGSKSWNKLKKQGLRKYSSDYFTQVQLGMQHLDLTDNPALFTAKNADTQEVYAELVPADAAAIQHAIDRAVKVVDTREPEEMPRVAGKATDFRCKWCDYAKRCWDTPAPAPDPEARPGWLGGPG